MIENIDFPFIFASITDAIYKIHKKNNGSIKNHTILDRFTALTEFIGNSCYWSRFTSSVLPGGALNGKYLNQIHNENVKYHVYESVYCELIKIYLKVTNYESLRNLSIDSSFIRNILGTNAARNPAYHNKPGYKVHALVDANRVALSICITDCNVHDSAVINQLLFKKCFVDKEIFSTYCPTFLADSAYSGFPIIETVTSIGFNVIMGRNKQHTKKNVNISRGYPHDQKHYKERGIVENFFGNFQRIPCLINNYEKDKKSYEGLALFYCASTLSKKINKIINHKNDEKLRIEDELRAKEKKHLQKIRKQTRYEYEKIKRDLSEKNNEERKKETAKKLEILKNYIWSQCDKNIIRKIYDKEYNQHIENININEKKRGRKKDISYAKYEKYIKEALSEHVRNNVLTKTYSYTFNNKILYFIKVDKEAFTLKTITDKMKNKNFNNKINEITNDFFG